MATVGIAIAAAKRPAIISAVSVLSLGLGTGVKIRREDSEGKALVSQIMVWSWLSDGANLLIGPHVSGPQMPNWVNSEKKVLGYLPGVLGVAALAHAQGYKNIWLVCVAGPLGDILESALKRYYGVSSSGALLPGYGGLLDRTDSLTLMLLAARFSRPTRPEIGLIGTYLLKCSDAPHRSLPNLIRIWITRP